MDQIRKDLSDAITNSNKLQDKLMVIAIEEFWEPHPPCIGGEAVQRYYIDESKPCKMRINPLTKEYSVKRDNNKGIIDTCGIPLNKHKKNLHLMLAITGYLKAQDLEESLSDGGRLKEVFEKHSIVGFGFVETYPQFELIM